MPHFLVEVQDGLILLPSGASVAFFAANKQGSDKNKYPYFEDEDVEMAKQKAEFICKAVNQHDNLVRTLKTVKGVLENWNRDGKYKNLIEYTEKALQEIEK